MKEILEALLAKLQDPKVLDDAGDLALLSPYPGPLLGAGLHLVASWIRAGKSIDEVKALIARYSAEAQTLASDWNG